MQFEIFSSLSFDDSVLGAFNTTAIWKSYAFCVANVASVKMIEVQSACSNYCYYLYLYFLKKMLWFAAVGWSLTWCSCCFCYYHYFFVQKEMKKKKKKKSNIVSYKFFYLIFPVHSTFCSYRWAILSFIHFTKISIETFLFRVANEIKPMRLQ